LTWLTKAGWLNSFVMTTGEDWLAFAITVIMVGQCIGVQISLRCLANGKPLKRAVHGTSEAGFGQDSFFARQCSRQLSRRTPNESFGVWERFVVLDQFPARIAGGV